MTDLSHATNNPGWIIAAIPKQDDYSWKISSEKIPHMTILFLGTPDYSPQETLEMLGYLAHAAKTMLPPFGLTVERRGQLGSNQADVLFFDKNFDSRITEFRSALLKNRKIQEAFKNAEQYPQWTPHLTLGYPEVPAKEDKRDYPGISWVNFDKIVLWVNDFSGYEILLDPEESDTVLMSELTHFGVPGMRWGHRKAQAVNATLIGPKAKTHYKTPPVKLTDQELMRRIGRLQQEKQYNELNRTSIQKGVESTNKLLVASGKTAVGVALTAVGVWAVKKAMGKVVGENTMKEIFPKKK